MAQRCGVQRRCVHRRHQPGHHYYTVKVQADGSLYGLCGYSFCTFEIPGQKVSADKNARITIRNEKFPRSSPRWPARRDSNPRPTA